VAIVSERVTHGFGNNNGRREVDDGVDPVFADQAGDEGLVAAVAGDQGRAFSDRPGEPGREIVEDDDALAGIAELEHHMTAAIAGSADDQYCHLLRPCARSFRRWRVSASTVLIMAP